jgi:hypothetical protein
VAVTGDTTRDRPEYIALGFDDYATKPISMAAVQGMLATRRTRPATARRSALGADLRMRGRAF